MPLAITAVGPSRGPIGGDTTVSIDGTDFVDGATVTFGTVRAKKVTWRSATLLEVVTARGARVEQVNVTVRNPDAAYVTSANAFEYHAVITKVEPEEGPTAAGAPIAFIGEGFQGVGLAFELHDGARRALGAVNVVSDTRVTATLPAHAPGVCNMAVWNAAGTEAEIKPYSFVLLVSGASPNVGRPGGGEQVVITGKYFAAGARVRFGGVISPAVNVDSPTQITATTPAGAGLVAIEVTNNPGTAAARVATLASAFTFSPATVVSITPATGPAGGGTPVKIKGRCFGAGPTVTIGGANVVPTTVTADTITLTTPPGAGRADVVVQNAAGGEAASTLAGGFEYAATPTVTAVKPDKVLLAGGEITIEGTNFAAGATVKTDLIAATNVTVVSATAIKATVPAHAAGVVNVTVANAGGTPVTMANALTYVAVTIDPPRGVIGGNTPIVIRGAGFSDEAVTVGGVAVTNKVLQSPTEIRCNTGAHATGRTDVALRGWFSTTTLAAGFMYSNVARVDPTGGPLAGGTPVTIHGEGFDGTTTVDFGATATGAPVVGGGGTTLTVNSPGPAPAGAVNVVVHFGGVIGDVTLATAFTYRGPPVVTAIDPAIGATAGGTTVTITGTGFVEGAGVAVGVNNATTVRVVSPTTITATTPGGAVGAPVAVTVTNPDAQAHALAASFTYRNAPTVTSIDPITGPIAGGRTVRITGTNFVAGVKVFFANDELPGATFVNATTIDVPIIAHAVGAVNVTVRNPGDAAASAALVGGFTYVNAPTVVGHNAAEYLIDGEEYFERLRVRFEEVRAAPPHELTYVRMAFWMIDSAVTLGDNARFNQPAHKLLTYIDQTIRCGHNVDIIVWRPSKRERVDEGKGVAESNEAFAKAVWDIDVAAVAAGPQVGRARVFLEQYEGELGASLHQKIAIFSIRGQRRAIIGGINLAPAYFDLFDEHPKGWHDAAVELTGPATDDVEAEWMRRWKRTRVVTEKWVWSELGGGGVIYARNFSFTEWNTVRLEAVSIAENKTPQTRQGAARAVCVATTRAVGTTRYRWIREKVMQLIRSATTRIYMENYLFTDPDIVRELYRRHEAVRGGGGTLRIAVVTNPQGGMIGYMCRRSWLQLVLRLKTGGGAGVPMCVSVDYTMDNGATTVNVIRANCNLWTVADTYNDQNPTATRWLEGDTLTYRLAAMGSPTVTVPLENITSVDGAFHLYTPWRFTDGRGQMMVHSKIGIFDNVVVIGSANWSFRSMQYDGEISAIIDHAGDADMVLDGLIGHYNTGVGVPGVTMANIEAEATANIQAAAAGAGARFTSIDGHTALIPLCWPGSVDLPRARSTAWLESHSWLNYTWY